MSDIICKRCLCPSPQVDSSGMCRTCMFLIARDWTPPGEPVAHAALVWPGSPSQPDYPLKRDCQKRVQEFIGERIEEGLRRFGHPNAPGPAPSPPILRFDAKFAAGILDDSKTNTRRPIKNRREPEKYFLGDLVEGRCFATNPENPEGDKVKVDLGRLRILAVRQERLQVIQNSGDVSDLVAEGYGRFITDRKFPRFREVVNAIDAFANDWDGFYEGEFSWESNPLVRVYTFRREAGE